LLLAPVLLLTGCGQTIAPEVIAIRESVLLSEEPSGAISIQEAKDSSAAAQATTPQAVTLIGQIDAGDSDPFDQTQAAFVLSELPDESHGGEGHDAGNCPFCKRKAAAAPKAYVTLHDGVETKIPTPATDLLGLQKGDRVVVQGTAIWNEPVNMLSVEASKIYVFR